MANALGDVLDIIKLCKTLTGLVTDLRNAPIEYQSSVDSLTSMHGAFECMIEEIQQFSPANSFVAVGEHLEIRHRLSSEIALVRTALKKAEDVLLERYAADANSHGFRALTTRVYWRTTRSRFEKCLRNAREHLDCILAILGAKQIKLNIKLHESIAALNVHLNDRPLPIGLPGSGGVPQDHVRFRDGLGRDTYLLMDLCPSPQRLQEFLKIMFLELPGRRHIEKQHYRLYCDSNSHRPQELTKDSWPYLVDSGCSILLAFVVGTWQMNCITFCPMCNEHTHAGWNSWHNCRCGCLYFVSEAGEVDYEPRDGLWFGEARDLQDWKSSKKDKQQKPKAGPQDAAVDKNSTSKQALKQAEQMPEADTGEQDFTDESYFRCMVMVYDPIFNLVCRNVFCRCILGATCFTSDAPQIDVPSTIPCPNHAKSGIRPNLDAVSLTFNDCDDDPYFEQFGGYGNFKQISRYLNQGTIAIAFVDVDKLCPEEAQDQSTIANLISTYSDAVSQYRREVLSRLQYLWQKRTKVEYEKLDPEFVLSVDSWMSDEQDDLAKQADSAGTSSTVEQHFASLYQQDPMIPCLRKGRLTLESVETIRHKEQYVCVWP